MEELLKVVVYPLPSEEEAGSPYIVNVTGNNMAFYEVHTEPGAEYTFDKHTPFNTYSVQVYLWFHGTHLSYNS